MGMAAREKEEDEEENEILLYANKQLCGDRERDHLKGEK